jgi:hypothetical protein
LPRGLGDACPRRGHQVQYRHHPRRSTRSDSPAQRRHNLEAKVAAPYAQDCHGGIGLVPRKSAC